LVGSPATPAIVLGVRTPGLPQRDTRTNPLLPEEPKVPWRERERLAHDGPPGHEEALQESRRRQVEQDYRARYGPEDRRRFELAAMLARGEIDTAGYAAAIRALDEEQAKSPPPEPAPTLEDPWQHIGPEAEMRLRSIIERGLPTKTYLDPRSGRPFDTWAIEMEGRDTSGFLQLGPCRAMGESEEANPGPANLLEDDPRLLGRILWRRRPPGVTFLLDDELGDLPPPAHDLCPVHGTELIDNDPTPPANALCRREEGGAVIEHIVGARYEADEWGRQVRKVRIKQPRVRVSRPSSQELRDRGIVT
jgi:hypothetical protein